MNKREFIETLIDMGGCSAKLGTWARGWDDAISEVLGIADELDESQKPTIPQFVADWIEEERAKIIDWHTEIPERFFLILGHKLNYTTLANTNIGDWVFGGNEEKLYQALKYGYEVEKEKTYIVDIEGILFLAKFDDEPDVDAYGETILYDDDYIIELTEKEIKDYDERYWAFAQEVCHV